MDADREGLLNTISKNTINFRLKDWITNFAVGTNPNGNAQRCQGGYGVASLIDSLKYVPCIIVGSGPSLDGDIRKLKGLEDRCCIITSDSTFKALINNGIHPHLCLSTDSKGKCREFFEGIDVSKYNFILDTFCHPDTADMLSAGRIYWYSTLPVEYCEFTSALNQWTGFIGNLGTGGCVATTIWSLAVQLLGCDPCLLVGLPQSYPDKNHQYARCVEEASGKGIDQYTVDSSISVKDIYGRDTWTQPGFQSFAYWFQDAFAHVPAIHINCSGGLMKEHCLTMNLETAIERYLNHPFEIETMLFHKELSIEKTIQDTGKEHLRKYKPLLTILIDGPSVPNLSLRTGKTEEEIVSIIDELKQEEFVINELNTKAVNPENGQEIEIQAYQLVMEAPAQEVPPEVVEMLQRQGLIPVDTVEIPPEDKVDLSIG